ncbi:TPA: hypothetical protein ACG8YV_002790, partial [Enterococcus faecium]
RDFLFSIYTKYFTLSVSYILKYAATLNFRLEKDELIDMIKFTAIVQLLINITIVICGVYMLLK